MVIQKRVKDKIKCSGAREEEEEEGSEVLIAVVVNSSIFWDITSCSPLKAKLIFNGLHGVISQNIELLFFLLRIEVPRAVTMESTVYWFVTPCSLERAGRSSFCQTRIVLFASLTP
jgi:hypothetical protein